MLILHSKYLYIDIQSGVKLMVTGSKQFIKDLVKEFYNFSRVVASYLGWGWDNFPVVIQPELLFRRVTLDTSCKQNSKGGSHDQRPEDKRGGPYNNFGGRK